MASDNSSTNGLIGDATTAITGAANSRSGGEMASILARVQALETEKKAMAQMNENMHGKLAKFQEGKKAEMELVMNTTIRRWLDGLDTKDTEGKKQLECGLNKLIDDSDESGVWNMIACASSNWVSNVNSIETLTNEVNAYKEKEKIVQDTLFVDESSRMVETSVGHKRGHSEMSAGAPKDIWNEFESIMMARGGNTGEVMQEIGSNNTVNELR
jgi:hypothetical protein